MPVFTPRLTALDEREVRRYARGEKLEKHLIEEAISNALIYAKAMCIYNVFDYDYKNSDIFFKNKRIFLPGNSIKKHLYLCEKIAVIAVTVGYDIENMVNELIKSEKYAAGLLLDAAATEAVEESANMLDKLIERDAQKEGYNITSRFSPGYGDFPLTSQKEILSLASANEIGVTLTSSLMLMPRKSITALIGFKRETVNRKNHRCNECNKKDCTYRK